MVVSDVASLLEDAKRVADQLYAAGSRPSVAADRASWVQIVEDLQSVINTLAGAQDQAMVRAVAIDEDWDEDGVVVETHRALGHVSLDGPDLVAMRLRLPHAAVSRRVETAVRVAAGRQPQFVEDTVGMPKAPEAGPGQPTGLGGLAAAMRCGRLDGYRASVIADELADAPAEAAALVIERLDAEFDLATGAQLRARTRKYLAQVDQSALRLRMARARADIRLERWVNDPGVDTWRANLPAELALPAWAAVDQLARDYVKAGTYARMETARAHALCDLITGQATIEVNVVVTVPASALPEDGDSPNASTPGPSSPGSGPSRPGSDPRKPDLGEPELSVPILDRGVSDQGVPVSNESGGDERGLNSAEASDSEVRGRGARACELGSGEFGPATSADSRGAGAIVDPRADDADGGPALLEVTPIGRNDTVFLDRDWLAGSAFVTRRVQKCDSRTGALLPDDWLGMSNGPCKRGKPASDIRPPHPRQPSDPRPGEALSPEPGRYRPGGKLIDLIKARDGRCRFPGCSINARFCDVDHVRAWPEGPTHADNLMCLCRRHHRVKQSAGWRVRLTPGARAVWRDPTGREQVTLPVDRLSATSVTLDTATSLAFNTAEGEACTDRTVDKTVDKTAEAKSEADMVTLSVGEYTLQHLLAHARGNTEPLIRVFSNDRQTHAFRMTVLVDRWDFAGGPAGPRHYDEPPF